MRKIAILGASALVFVLGVAQVSASPQRKDLTGYFTQNPYWGESTDQLNGTAQMPSIPKSVGFGDFRAQAPESAMPAPYQIYLPHEHHGR